MKRRNTAIAWNSIRAKILLLLVSLIVGFALLEASLRLLGFRPHRPIDAILAENSDLGYVLVSSAHQTMETSEARYDVTIENGRRSIPEQTWAPDDAKTPVYAIGDSFCFGQAVDDKNVWINFLAKSIGRAHNLYFYNLGVPGYSPEQYLLTIEKLPQDLSKTVVIYFLFMGNDITRWTVNDFMKNINKIEVRPHDYKLLRWLSYHSATVWSICAIVVSYKNQQIRSELFKSLEDFEDFKRNYPNWKNTVNLVSQSLETVAQRGGKSILTIIPNGQHYLTPEGVKIAQYVGNKFSEEIRRRIKNAEILDMSQYLYLGHQLMFHGLGHFNADGNHRVAELLEPILVKIINIQNQRHTDQINP